MDIKQILNENSGRGHNLFAEYLNPQLVKVLRTIGFDRNYVRAEGSYLYDDKGDRYLDFLSGYGVFNIGRNHPKMKSILKDAIDTDSASMVQMDAPLLAGLLAEKLLAKFHDGLDKIFFTNSGTEANEGAIKFAKCATGKPRVLFLDHAFHGLTNGSLSCNGNEEFRKGFGALLPGCTAIPFGDTQALETELKKEDVAAFLYEPVQGKGVNIPPDGFLEKAQALCKKYGTLTIADEVQSGLGRTGKWFAFEHFGLEPDIVTVAKALSGGFIPVGAICYRKDTYKKVYSGMERCVVHSNTFGRNTLAMVAGLASLEIIEDERLVENAEVRGNELISGLNELMQKYELIGEVRGKGLMIGIEFKRPQSKKLKIGWDLIHKVNSGLFGQMVVVPLFTDHKILTQVAGHNVTIVKLLPPLVITKEDVDYFLTSFDQVVANCHKFPGGAWKVGKTLAKQALRAS
jgi:acetylornithine/succinyldiaminopimelate/putrescine aminotransferase